MALDDALGRRWGLLITALAAIVATAAIGISSDAHARKKPLTKVKADGFTSPIAEKHKGHVVFSKARVARAPKTDAPFVHKFSLSDPIHMRAFLTDSFYNMLVDKGIQYRSTSPHSDDLFAFEVTVDGHKKPIRIWDFHPGEDLIKTDLAFPLGGSEHFSLTAKANFEGKRDPASRFITQILPLLKEGDNKITVTFKGHCRGYGKGYVDVREPLGEGSFILSIKPGEIKKFIKSHGPRLAKSKHRKNKKLVKLFKKTIEREWKKETYIGSVTTSKQWHVKLHRYHGRPTERTVNAVVVLKHEKHDYCRAFNLTFAQTYAGRGNKFHDHMRIYVGGNKRFPCENAPKR